MFEPSPELTEFVLQLDEEVEAMQAVILHLEQQQHKHGKNALSITNSTSSSKGGKDRTKGTVNGPVETPSTSVSAT